MDSVPIIKLKGIGEKTQGYFHKLGIESTKDLVFYYPRNYLVFEEPIAVKDVNPGCLQAVLLQIKKIHSLKKARNLTILNIDAYDNTGMVGLVFFNMPYLAKVFKPGASYVFRGNVTQKGTSLCMEQPAYYACGDYYDLIGMLQPQYALTKGLSNATIKKAVLQVLEEYLSVEEVFPQEMLSNLHLISLPEAIQNMHFPRNTEQLEKARKRLAFQDFFLFLYYLRKNKADYTRIQNPYRMLETAHTLHFIEQLPYKLTNAQKRAWQDIKEDVASDYCMNRMVQGDVGSGKTILAELALLMCVANGYQGALMAPTEVLAKQHYATFTEHAKQYQLPFSPVLLIGSMSAGSKREAYEGIRTGKYNVIIGTHALIQDKVEYKELALVITDEQHRFGVRQREALFEKGLNPHILVMSATPIPRSLSLILFGDLDISVMNELPAERLPIKNCAVNISYREKAYSFIKEQIKQGRQAFVICPMVEESESEFMDYENVLSYTTKLNNYFDSSVHIAYLHGKMKSEQKNQIMEQFARNEIQILVSTTVIEVGINVPNATVMMVENAQAFGLAQLHQLRGRVGRGAYQSYCIFINTKETEHTKERLSILCSSNDGFHIASEDMRLRGPGDIFGVRQSGELSFPVADIYGDSDILFLAQDAVNSLLEKAPEKLSREEQSLLEYLDSHGKDIVDFRSI